MVINELIDEYLSVKVRILAGKKFVSEMSVRERAGLLLKIVEKDVQKAIAHGQGMITILGDRVEILRWHAAIKLLEEIK